MESQSQQESEELKKVMEIIKDQNLVGLKELIDSGWNVNTVYKEVSNVRYNCLISVSFAVHCREKNVFHQITLCCICPALIIFIHSIMRHLDHLVQLDCVARRGR